ncbi:unnamed protein product [Rangifer tarandus platyrhynchus]|uniref:Uncharacterized protein n=1 Tax=Rangifer tarandus platyrhynchus TaxID=3082113 RepID=A0AC59Y8F1_RANTA
MRRLHFTSEMNTWVSGDGTGPGAVGREEGKEDGVGRLKTDVGVVQEPESLARLRMGVVRALRAGGHRKGSPHVSRREGLLATAAWTHQPGQGTPSLRQHRPLCAPLAGIPVLTVAVGESGQKAAKLADDSPGMRQDCGKRF